MIDPTCTVVNPPPTRVDVSEAAEFFDHIPHDRPDTLASGPFGLYTDAKREPVIADNVRLPGQAASPRSGGAWR